jgi:lysophospholipase L1-like esterase
VVVRFRSICAALAVLALGFTGAVAAESVEAMAAGESGEAVVSAAAADGAPTVGMVGNSISRQSEAEIRRHVGLSHRLVYFDAVIGTTVAAQRSSMVNAVRSPGGPDIVLVELGANDASKVSRSQFERDVRLTLDAVTPYVDTVVWFDMKNTSSAIYPDYVRNAPSFNATLRAVVAEYPNAIIGHYSAWADAAGDAAFAADLVHLSRWGQNELGRLAKQAADGFDPALTSGPFWDVPDSYWVADEIAWLHDTGLATGYSNGTYRARIGSVKVPITRGQLASMLWHHAGSPTVTDPHPFIDVP